MKALMVTEDRDLAYLILDTSVPVPDASPVNVSLAPDVNFSDVGNEDVTQWCMLSEGLRDTVLTVVQRESFDFDGDFDKSPGFPIPTPVIMLDKDEYDRRDQ